MNLLKSHKEIYMCGIIEGYSEVYSSLVLLVKNAYCFVHTGSVRFPAVFAIDISTYL